MFKENIVGVDPTSAIQVKVRTQLFEAVRTGKESNSATHVTAIIVGPVKGYHTQHVDPPQLT